MNGINLRKLGAIVAGGAILASSVAFAGLWYGNTELVNANGQPVAKIVVGEKAAASDGVAAAMIAAKIANSAYTEKDYTAAISGNAICTAGNATGGSASCTTTDKTTTLEIIYPGMTGTAVAEINPLIAETVDRELLNRDVDDQDKTNDFEDEKSYPFQDGDGGEFPNTVIEDSDDGDNYQYYKIDGNMLSALAETSISSKQTSSTFTEQQYIYLQGKTSWQSDENKIIYAPDRTVYLLTFGPNDDGLALCPGDTTKSYADCDANDMIGKGRYTIKLFGEQWVLSDIVGTDANVMDAAGDASYDSQKSISVADGTTTGIRLAKEAVYNPALHKDECMNTTDIKICLSDISRETGEGNEHPAIMTIYDAAGNHVTEKQIGEGDTETITVNGKQIKVHIYQTAPGYAMSSMWAEVAIYSDEIEIYNDREFTYGIKGFSGDDSLWNVHLGFVDANGPLEHVDADPGPPIITEVNALVEDATGLKAIWITTADSSAQADGELMPGDSYNIIDTANYQGFVVKNNGLDTQDMDTLKFDYKAASTTVTDQILDVPIILENRVIVTSTASDKSFEIVGSDAKHYSGSELLVGTTDDAEGGDYYVIIKQDSDKKWYASAVMGDGDDMDITYDWAGDDGNLNVAVDEDGGAKADYSITLTENVGKVLDNDGVPESLTVFVSAAKDELWSDVTGDDTDMLLWTAPAGYDEGTYSYTDGDEVETGFITMRGTEYSSESSTSRTLKIPKVERHLQLTVAPTSVNASRNAEIIGPLHVGDEKTVGGSITVKVTAIDCQSSASVAGGSVAGCVADVSGQTAVIKDAAGASVSKLVAKEVYAVPSDLVVLDSQASDAKTIITVGGNKVNTVTAAAMQGAAVDLSASNPVVVKEIEGKIIVAGWTASDTLKATADFIAGMKAQQ